MDSLEQFIVRKSKKSYLIHAALYAVLTIIIFIRGFLNAYHNGYIIVNEKKMDFPANNNGTYMMIGMVCFFFIPFLYYFFNSFDNNPRLIISKEGIWHYKHKNFRWDQVRSVVNDYTNDRYKFEKVYLKFKDSDIEIKLIILYIDCSTKLLIEKIRYFKGNHKVIELID